MSIHVTTLGSVAVSTPSGEVTSLAPRRLPLAVLVYVAVERSCSRESLTGVFWEDRPPERARHSLSQVLYELKQQLGEGWLRGDGPRLDVSDSVRVDLFRFEEAVAGGDLQAALDLYRGPFLGTFSAGVPAFEHWGDRIRTRLAREHRKIRREFVDERLGAGDVRAALDAARRWVELEPLDDEGQHRYIELLAGTGDRAAALRQFDVYRALLAEDDLWPLDQTRELVDRLRAGETVVPEGLAAAGDLQSRTPPAFPMVGVGDEERERTAVFGAQAFSGPRLVRVVEGGLEVETYPLANERTVIGRERGDLTFPQDAFLSQVHASVQKVTVSHEGREPTIRFVLTDEGSRNGVFLRIRQEWPLKPGDVIAAGGQVFRFESE